MSAVEKYRKLITETYPPFHAFETQIVKEYADAALAELEARIGAQAQALESFVQIEGDYSESQEFIRSLNARIAELIAENERLRVGGNCLHHHSAQESHMQGLHFCDLDDSGCFRHARCHFTPSRWAERETS